MPVNGEVLEFNAELESNPEIVNKDPYGEGWIVRIKIFRSRMNSTNLSMLTHIKN